MKLNLSSNSLMMEEEVSQINENKKQGIVSILGSSCDSAKSTKAASLRRTLSADMSSKPWLSQNGFSSIKKIASSDDFPTSEEEDEADEIWASIQRDKNAVQEAGKQVDVWNSILLSTNNNDKQAEGSKDQQSSTPYVHPLVKRSKSSLSQRSLQICTESLGSETGSEGFSSDSPSSDEEDNNKEDRTGTMVVQSFEEEVPIVANKYSVSSYYCDKKSSPSRSFPPPIPSLSPSLRMQSHRQNGRLVLEAVSVPTKTNFHAQRQDGRLVLTFVKKDEQVVQQEKKDVFDEVDVDQEQEAAGAKLVEKVDQGFKFVASEVINIPNRGAIMANKFMRLSNRNSPWAKKFNEKVELDDKEAELADSKTLLPQSLPPPPRVPRRIPPIPASPSAAAAASFNAYEYCWRRKASAASFMPTLTGKNQLPPPSPKNNINNNNMFVLSKSSAYANCKTPPEKTRSSEDCKLKNKADYLVPLTRNCMEPRRHLSFWETYCIATST